MQSGPRSSSRLRRLLERLERLLHLGPGRFQRLLQRKLDAEPEDPYAYSMAPLRRPPNSRSGAAVADLDEE